jgi:hypothetical protein
MGIYIMVIYHYLAIEIQLLLLHILRDDIAQILLFWEYDGILEY